MNRLYISKYEKAFDQNQWMSRMSKRIDRLAAPDVANTIAFFMRLGRMRVMNGWLGNHIIWEANRDKRFR